MSTIKKLKQNLIYKDQWVEFYQDDVELLDGSKSTYAWAKRKNGVGIVVVTKDKKILLNKEFRYVVHNYSWEIPGGGVDEGESLENAAKRELQEETGIQVETVTKLGLLYPLNSFNTETMTIFYTIIDEVKPTSAGSEVAEQFAEQKYVSFDEALQMIDNGEITEAVSASAVQMVIRKLQGQSL